MQPEELFLKQISTVIRLPKFESQDKLSELLSLDATKNQFIVKLQPVLQGTSNGDISDLVTKQNYFDGDWPGFEELIASFLKYCRDINPWSSLESFDLISQFYSDLAVAFTNMKGFVLIATVFRTTSFIIPIAKVIDNAIDSQKKMRSTFISTILLKLFNNIRAEREINNKRSIILFIGISLCKIYFRIGNPLLCSNVFSNMNNAGLKFSDYPKSQQIEYRFMLGKFYLIKNQLINAFHHFNWSYQNCLISCHRNIEIILHYLIPVGVLIGKLPNFNLLNNFPSLNVYKPLIYHLKKGDMMNYMKYVYDNESFFKQRKLLVLLVERSRILLLRNLFFKIHKQMGFPTKLSYDYLLCGLNFSVNTPNYMSFFKNTKQYNFFLNESSINDDFIENLFISLIDQNLVRGKIFPRLRTISLAKSDAFPNIYMIYTQKFLLHKIDIWMDNDF